MLNALTREDFLQNGVVQPIVTDSAILGLYGPYRCLSNFHKHPFVFRGRTYQTSEAAYMSEKTLDPREKDYLATLYEGKEAKAYGYQITLRDEWDDRHRIHAMYRVLFAKFTQDISSLNVLLSTGDKYIEETNWWGDVYWGRCGGVGTNHLGSILMTIRDFVASK